MSRDPVTLPRHAAHSDAMQLFLEHRISCIPIVDEDFKPVGILSWRDVFKRTAPHANTARRLRARHGLKGCPEALRSSACKLLALAASAAGAAVPDIYPDPSRASTEIAAAVKTAAAAHKRIILDFGGNWCTDCHVLDYYFHDATNGPVLEANYILVHVNVGHMDANVDIASRYEIPLNRGVPAMRFWMATASCYTAKRAASSKPCAACKAAR